MKTLFGMLSPEGTGRLSILIFHRVHARPDPLFPTEPDAQRFDRICSWLSRWFHVMPLDRAVEALKEGHLPSRAACITFDDGYADNHDVALPILQRHGLPATFFIATGYLDGGRMFNDTVAETFREAPHSSIEVGDLASGLPDTLDLSTLDARRRAIADVLGVVKHLPVQQRESIAQALQHRAAVRRLPQGLMMQSAQVLALHRAGMQVGAHTRSHPILAHLDRDAARREILEGRDELESITDAPVRLFAYPNGRPHQDYSRETVSLVSELGFSAAVTTAWGSGCSETDLLQLPRFTPWDLSGTRFGFRLLANLRRRGQAV